MKAQLKSNVGAIENGAGNGELFLGNECHLKFNLNNYLIHQIDDRIEELAEVGLSHFKAKTVFYLLDSLVKGEQLSTVNEFFNQAVNFLKNQGSGDLSANLEFEIVTLKATVRQVLFQFGVTVPDHDNLVYGKMIDISHFKDECPPRLFIINRNGKIEKSMTNSLTLLRDAGLDLSPKEINVILLKSKGMRAKEIAIELGISSLSVYSIIRDIKQKTSMELLPLVVYLKKMGVVA